MKSSLYNGDCLEYMKEDMFVGQVHTTITSPPYNMNLRIRDGKYVSRAKEKNKISTKYSSFSDDLTTEEYYNFNKEVIHHLLQISNLVFYNVQFLTGNKRALFKLMGEFNEQLKEVIIWNKINGEPAVQEQVLNSQYEVILVFDKDNAIARKFDTATFDRGTLSNVWDIKRGKKLNKEHGAVFPEELVEKILHNFTKPGDVVFDPFMGTGTVGVVCNRLKRWFIGIELDEDYFNFAKERIDERH
jgi:site-specific DNA-methyltransferase (adenine-specific)/modification methylase